MPAAAALSDDDRLVVAHCAALSFPPASQPPPPPTTSSSSSGAGAGASFQVHHASHPYPCAAFAFPPSWSAAPGWAAAGRAAFGDAEVDPSLFPSLRSVGSGVPARANAAFLASFGALLDGSPLQSEVSSPTSSSSRSRRLRVRGLFGALLFRYLCLLL
jgi:enhanced disease susceptibility 1 protein